MLQKLTPGVIEQVRKRLTGTAAPANQYYCLQQSDGHAFTLFSRMRAFFPVNARR